MHFILEFFFFKFVAGGLAVASKPVLLGLVDFLFYSQLSALVVSFEMPYRLLRASAAIPSGCAPWSTQRTLC